MHCWLRCRGREKRPHSELILAWYCYIDAAGVVLVHCSDALDVQRLNLCLWVVHTGYVKPVTCWSYILEKPFRYFVHFSFLSAYHASWRQRGTWNRFLYGPWNGPKIWWPFSSPSICFIIAYLCISIYRVHLLVCAIVFCRGVSHATFLSEI